MKCRKCGINNPINVNKCLYCGTPLPTNNNVNRKNTRGNNSSKKQREQTDNIIIGIVAALVAVLLVIVGIFTYQHMPRKNGFGIGGGGGGGIIASSGDNTGNPSLDGKDPDVEVYSFTTDTYDILVGATKSVKFTAEIFTNIELGENDVSVVNGSGSVIGYMNDTGADGDSVANDGIYTLVADLSSDSRKSAKYQVKAKGASSNELEIYFYTEISAAEYAECSTIFDRLNELAVMDEIKKFLTENASVENYTITEYGVKYALKSGITCIWEEAPGTEGLKGSGRFTVTPFADYTNIRSQITSLPLKRVHGDGDVCVVRPFRTSQFKYDDFLHAGNILGNVLGGSVNTYDDGNASLDVFKSFNKYGVILIDSHGTLSTDPYLLTGTKFSPGQQWKSADLQSGRIVLCSGFINKTVAVGPKFFDRYYSDNSLDGAIFYLGTCYSMYNDSLADVLLDKGAEVVYGFSQPVSVTYCNDILKELFMNQLVIGTSTSSDGLIKSKQAQGSLDPHNSNNCELRMKGDNSFKLVSDKGYGSINGSVKDAATSRGIANALVRIYQDGELINSIRTNGQGLYTVSLLEGDYVVKVTCGQYKSAKVSVNVAANVTTYVETLLMLDAGITSGYANGTITDATNGDEVPGVSIRLRRSWNNRDGAVIQTTTTNENGYYEFSYDPGFYTIEFSKEGYITGYKNIIIGTVDFAAQNAVISPEMPEDGNFRIVLSWSNVPNDLDSHLTGPTVDGDRFHLYYKYANTGTLNNNSDYYQLDLDNTNIVEKPNIPETTTIVTQLDGIYRYSVHDFTNKGNANSDAMARSNATVNVYKGSVLVATYHVPPTARGTIWTVFELSGDVITPINQIGNGLETDSQF